jgi:hypothetical protein
MGTSKTLWAALGAVVLAVSCVESQRLGFDAPEASVVAVESQRLGLAAADGSSLCGNGIVDPGEQCDLEAGNGQPSTCCTATCQLAPAGQSCTGGYCDGTSPTCREPAICIGACAGNAITLNPGGPMANTFPAWQVVYNGTVTATMSADETNGIVVATGNCDTCDTNDTPRGNPTLVCPTRSITFSTPGMCAYFNDGLQVPAGQCCNNDQCNGGQRCTIPQGAPHGTCG